MLGSFLAALILAATASQAEQLTFTLQHFDKGEATRDSYAGQYLMTAVGYLSCPDIYPETISNMAIALDGLGTDQSRVSGFFWGSTQPGTPRRRWISMPSISTTALTA